MEFAVAEEDVSRRGIDAPPRPGGGDSAAPAVAAVRGLAVAEDRRGWRWRRLDVEADREREHELSEAGPP